MPHHRYLIVGGGMAADAAARGIRSLDPDGSIGIVGEEPDPPYDRPPLSKGLWDGADESRIWRDTASLDVDLHLGRRITRLDPDTRSATDGRGVVYTWDKLLLATGATARTLDDGVPQVIYFRTLRDYRKLREAAEHGRRFLVVGGGFIGSEVAAALAGVGKQVTLVFPEEGIGAAILPPDQARFLNGYYRERGVDVRAGAEVASVRRSGDRLLVAARWKDEEGEEREETFKVNGVVAGLGVEPNTLLAGAVGAEVGDGIEVDRTLRTANPDVWAAGDVASVWCPPLGKRMRVEHEDQANSSGFHAGRSMAGAQEEYDHLPYFYSDLFDVGYEAVGELDPGFEVVADWAEPHRRGVLYYVREGRVRGVLLWNVKGKLKAARALVCDAARRGSASAWRGAIPLDGG
ncbi:MAG: NAD(P)/FAD-dependent oxidoreductase [Gemmatimonadetes bacterium]|nr:NAD(P)/FAD-dependent oxidoreductase [Gemmatimonadota bacterium]